MIDVHNTSIPKKFRRQQGSGKVLLIPRQLLIPMLLVFLLIEPAQAGCLFRAIAWESIQRLSLVGDPNQLPPIGCGQVFADVIDYLREHQTDSIAILEDNLRLLLNRTQGQLAPRIRNSEQRCQPLD